VKLLVQLALGQSFRGTFKLRPYVAILNFRYKNMRSACTSVQKLPAVLSGSPMSIVRLVVGDRAMETCNGAQARLKKSWSLFHNEEVIKCYKHWLVSVGCKCTVVQPDT
jgi:hypothetical protein